MTIDISKLQRDLSEAADARVSDKDIAASLNLSDGGGEKRIRLWKKEGASGPAEVAFAYMAQGLPDAQGEYAAPEFVIGPSPASEGSLFIVRLRYPRFVGWIDGKMSGGMGRTWHAIDDTELKMTVTQWIDTKTFGNPTMFDVAVRDACAAIRDRILNDR